MEKTKKLLNVYMNNSETATRSGLRRGKLFNGYIPKRGRHKEGCDTFLTYSNGKRQRMVINLKNTSAAHRTRVTGTADRLLGKYVTQTPRSNTLLFTNKNTCVSDSTILTLSLIHI